MKCKDRFISDTDIQRVNEFYGIGKSTESFIEQFRQNKEAFYAQVLPATNLLEDDVQIEIVINAIRNRNLIGNNEVADKVYQLNRYNLLDKDSIGVESKTFNNMWQAFTDAAGVEVTSRVRQETYRMAYKEKVKLFSYEVNDLLDSYLFQTDKTSLKDKGILNNQEEPIITIKDGDLYIKTKDGDKLFAFGKGYGLTTGAKLLLEQARVEEAAKLNQSWTPPISNEITLKEANFSQIMNSNVILGKQSVIDGYFFNYLNEHNFVLNDAEFAAGVELDIMNLKSHIQTQKAKGQSVNHLEDEMALLQYIRKDPATISRNVKQRHSKLIEVKEETSDQAFDLDPNTVNPVSNISRRVKLLFYGLEDGVSGYIMPQYKDVTQAVYEVLDILQNAGDGFQSMVDELSKEKAKRNDKGRNAIWLENLIKRLEAEDLSADMANLFFREMNKAYTPLPYFKQSYNSELKQNEIKKVDSNRSTADVMRQWKDNLLNKPMFRYSVRENTYIVGTEEKDIIRVILNEFEVAKAIFTPSTSGAKISADEMQSAFEAGIVGDLLKLIGVELSKNHVKLLSNGEYVLEYGFGDNKKEEEIRPKSLFDQNGMLNQIMIELGRLAGSTRTSYRRSELKLFDERIIALAKNETNFSDYTKQHGAIIGKTKHHPYTYHSLWTSKMKELQNGDRIGLMEDDIYTQSNYWMKFQTINQLEFEVLPGGVLQKWGVNDDKLNKLSAKDIMKVKMRAMLNNPIRPDGSQRGAIRMPTPSDNASFYMLNGEAFNYQEVFRQNFMHYDNPRAILSNEALKEFFNVSVLPEIKRIRRHNNTVSNSDAWNRGGGKFINWPGLNELQVTIYANENETDIGKEEVDVRLHRLGQLELTEDEKAAMKATATQPGASQPVFTGTLIDILKNEHGDDTYESYKEYIHDKIAVDFISQYFLEKFEEQKEFLLRSDIIRKKKTGGKIQMHMMYSFGENFDAITQIARNTGVLTSQVKGQEVMNKDIKKKLNDHLIDAFLMSQVFQEEFMTANAIQLFVGDPVMYHPDRELTRDFQENANIILLNMLKRMRNNNTPRATMNMDFFDNPNMGVIVIGEPKFTQSNIDYYKDVLKLSEKDLEKFKSIASMDAAEYITVRTRLKYMLANGDINQTQYDTELKNYNETGLIKDPSVRIGFSKDVYTGEVFDEEAQTMVPLHIKSGTTVLYGPVYNANSELKELVTFLEELEKRAETNDKFPAHIHLIPPSALKLGMPAWKKQQLFTDKGKFNDKIAGENAVNMMEIPLKYRGRQVNLPNKDQEAKQAQITFSSQLRSYVFTDMIDRLQDLSVVIKDKKIVNGHDLFEAYLDIIDDHYTNIVLDKEHQVLEANKADRSVTRGIYSETNRDEDGDIKDGGTGIQSVAVRKFLRSELMRLSETMESVHIDPDQIAMDEQGNFSETTFDKTNPYLETLLRSVINNMFFKTKVEGNSLSVVPAITTVFDNPGDPLARIIWMESKSEQILSGPGVGKTSIDVLIPSKLTDNDGNIIDLFEERSPGVYKYIQKTPENGFVLKEGIKREIFNTVAYRVPTVGHSYMMDVNVVGFLPPEMDMVMAHPDVIAKMGSDNDGDKLFFPIMNHHLKDNGEIELEKKDPGLTLNNEFVKIFKAILSNPNPEVQKTIYTPVDNPTASEQAKVYRRYKTKQLENLTSPSTQDELMRQNNSTKEGTELYSAFANLLSHVRNLKEQYDQDTDYRVSRWIPNEVAKEDHEDNLKPIDFKIGGLTFRSTVANDILRNEKGEPILDKDGKPKKIANAMQNNARKLSNAVDNAAKQYMADLGESVHTFNAIIGMMSFGMTHEVEVELDDESKFNTELVYLMLNQPIIRDFISRIDNDDTRILTNRRALNIIADMFPNGGFELPSANREETSLDIRSSTGAVVVSANTMVDKMNGISHQELMKRVIAGKPVYDESDIAILSAFMTFGKIGGQLSQVNNFLAIGRSGLPDTFYKMKRYTEAIDRMAIYEPIDVPALIFGKEKAERKGFVHGQQKVYPHGFIGNGVMYGVKEIKETLFKGTDSIYDKPIYDKVVDMVVGMLEMKEDVSALFPPNLDLGKDLGEALSLNTSQIGPIRPLARSRNNNISDIKYWRLKMYFDGMSDSLGNFISKIQNSDTLPIEVRENFFINALVVEPQRFPNITKISLRGDRTDPILADNLKKGLYHLLNNNDVIPELEWNGEKMSYRKLATYLYMYSALGASSNYNSDFTSLYPPEIKASIHNIKEAINRNTNADNESLIKNIALQIIQHNPWRINKSYRSEQSMVNDGFTFYANREKVDFIHQATKVVYMGPQIPDRFIYFNGFNSRYVLKKWEGDYDSDAVIYEVLDVLGNDDVTEYDPTVARAETMFKKETEKMINDLHDDFLGYMGRVRSKDKRFRLPEARIHTDDMANILADRILINELAVNDPLRIEMDRSSANLIEIESIIRQGNYDLAVLRATMNEIDYRMHEFYTELLNDQYDLGRTDLTEDEFEMIKSKKLAKDVVKYKELHEQYMLLRSSFPTIFTSEYYNPEEESIETMRRFTESFEVREKLGSQIYNIESFIDQHLDKAVNYNPVVDRGRWDIIRKYIDDFAGINLRYGSNLSRPVEYNPLTKEIDISYIDLKEIGDQQNTESKVAQMVLDELEVFYFQKKLYDYAAQKYDLVGDETIRYELKPGVEVDPTFDKIVGLYNAELQRFIETSNDQGAVPYAMKDLFHFVVHTFNVVPGGKTEVTPGDYVNHSGGADGADTEWDLIGSEFGMVNNKHYYHGKKTPRGNEHITTQDYEEGRVKSAEAAKRNWGYKFPRMKDDRLIRNWSQVKHSDAVFAIGLIVQPGERIFPNKRNDERVAVAPSVAGGTGYAVGMAINEGKPVFVFNQRDNRWYRWEINRFMPISTPKLTRNFAGIGSRTITDAGKQAIRDAYQKTFGIAKANKTIKVLMGVDGFTEFKDVIKNDGEQAGKMANRVYNKLSEGTLTGLYQDRTFGIVDNFKQTDCQ